MSTAPNAHQIAARLRGYAAGLELEVETIDAKEPNPAALPALTHKHETIQAWGTRVGKVLDQAFGNGLLKWEHYPELKADEARRRRDEADWHYRLFLATASEVAASEVDTGRVTIPGFLCSLHQPYHQAKSLEKRDCAHAYGEAIREVADLVDHAN